MELFPDLPIYRQLLCRLPYPFVLLYVLAIAADSCCSVLHSLYCTKLELHGDLDFQTQEGMRCRQVRDAV